MIVGTSFSCTTLVFFVTVIVGPVHLGQGMGVPRAPIEKPALTENEHGVEIRILLRPISFAIGFPIGFPIGILIGFPLRGRGLRRRRCIGRRRQDRLAGR